jgi:hypothetical protein
VKLLENWLRKWKGAQNDFVPGRPLPSKRRAKSGAGLVYTQNIKVVKGKADFIKLAFFELAGKEICLPQRPTAPLRHK